MKKSVLIIIVLIVVVGGGAVLIGMHNSGGMNMDKPAASTDSAKAVATNGVTIDNFAFSPMSITIKKGTTVTWTNKDSATHTVTETDGKTGPNSGNLPSGKSYSFTFNTAGTFKYHCAIHLDMLGTVTVTDQ